MKTIVNVLLAFIYLSALNAQTYAPDELVIEYDANATNVERQAVRNLYGITNPISIGDDIELWEGISFPLPVTENGSTTVINNVEELLDYIIEIQEGDEEENSNTTTSINTGNFNLDVFLDDIGILHEGGTFDPLPLCDDVHNSRLIGQDQSNTAEQNRIKIIIADQLVPNLPTAVLNSAPNTFGGSHGTEVYSIINNILTQAGLTQVEYINIPVFDSNGAGTSAALIELATYIDEQFETGNWSRSDPILINFSANVLYPEDLFLDPSDPDILLKSWDSTFAGGTSATVAYQNILVVSSVGNQAIDTENVFPGTADFQQQIAVAGTQNCFSERWINSNFSRTHYEIAAEAENVLTFDGVNYHLSTGTSFAAPQVTAVLAQLAADFLHTQYAGDLTLVKDNFLQRSPTNPALSGTVQNGRVLDISYVQSGGAPGGNFLQSTTPAPSLTLQTNPNPFSQNAIVNIGVEVGQSPNLSLYNSIGQLVHQEVIPNQQELTELQWYTPDQLARGTYLLRVQVGDKVEQQMIVKQ
ncbi:MAG: S8 family peptidase [Bacteroidota bacterium]